MVISSKPQLSVFMFIFLFLCPLCVYLAIFHAIFPSLRVCASSPPSATSHTHSYRIVGAGDSVPGP